MDEPVATKAATAAKRGRISSPKAKENSFTRKMKERRRHVDEAKESPSAPLLPRRKPTGGSPPPRTSLEIKLHERYNFFSFFSIIHEDFLDLFSMYCIKHCFICRPSDSADSSDFCIGSQLDLIHNRLDLIHTRLDLIQNLLWISLRILFA